MMTETESLKRKTDATLAAFKGFRLRWVTGRSKIKVEIDEDKYQRAVDSIMKDEIERQMLIEAIKEKGPLTVEELTEITDIAPSRIVQHLIAMRKNGQITEAGEKNRQYLYQVMG
jgi:DNA-binding transcriptional ArsR family regulator